MISLNADNLKIWQEEELEFLRYDYNLSPEDTVIDLGSYRQEWADRIRKDFGCKVICFDALDNNAAWLFDGVLTMGGAYYYTSLYEKGSSEYRCVDIAPFLKREIALLKINIEGGEYQILKYIFEEGLMKNVKELQVQFHLIEGIDTEDLYNEIAHDLSRTHKLTWRYPFVWENWKRC